MKFYGDAAKITATLLLPVGSTAGTTAGESGDKTAVSGDIATVGSAVTDDTAVAVTVTDANGTAIPSTTGPTAVSSNPGVVSASARMFIDSGISDVLDFRYSAGTFVQHYNYTTVAGSTSGAKSSVTYTLVNAAGTTLTSNAVSIAVGGAVATWTMTLDKSEYNPGEMATISVTAQDSAGNAAFDGQDPVADGFTSTLAITAPGAMTINDGKRSRTFFAPMASGTWTLTGYDAAGGSKAVTTTVTNPSADAKAASEAATDAAAEAIDAANAATDAANLAAEAADAATVAAEEARDAADAATAAVEELATQVATLMAALKAQITTLANTVAKIAKKVKA
jgi:hypothetical protein